MSRRTRVVVLVVVLVAGAILVRERYAPRLTLYVRDLLRPTAPPLTVPLTDDLALRLHTNTRPHIGKIAALQKGLVLVDGGRALIEEGYGFGTPIIQIGDVAYLSRHAQIALLDDEVGATLVKTYTIDVVDRPTRFLRVKYQDVAPLGTVVFSYTLRPPDAIDVMVDFRGLDVIWDRAYLMNEQGARTFTRYHLPSGEVLGTGDVGIWMEAIAPFGCWEAPERDVAFCVEALPGQPGFVGRERYLQYNWLGVYALSWSGVDIEIAAPRDTYTYTLRVTKGPDE